METGECMSDVTCWHVGDETDNFSNEESETGGEVKRVWKRGGGEGARMGDWPMHTFSSSSSAEALR